MNRLVRRAARCMAIALVVLTCSAVGHAQPEQTTRYVPDGTVAVISSWPKAMAAKEKMQYAPLEVISAGGLEQFGFDPLLFERIDVMVGMPVPMPTFGVLIQSSESIDLSNLPQQMVAATDDSGLVRLNGPEQIVVKKIDDTVAVMGTEPFVDMMLKERSGDSSKLQTTLETIRGPQDAVAVVDVEALRQLLVPMLSNPPPGAMPPQLQQGLIGMLKESDVLAVRAEISDQEKIQVVLASPDEAATKRLEKHIVKLLEFGREALLDDMQNGLPDDGTLTQQAMKKYITRISQVVVDTLKPRQVGNRLVMEVDQIQNAGVIGTLTGLLLPAVQSARGAARRMQSSNNLKQLALSMHNFESAYRRFPATASSDDDGKPLLSWRVAVLPFLEQNELYNRFHLDEPWDSEHNLALLEEMPDVYRHPGKATEPGHTVYQAPVGEHTLLRKDEPAGFGAITDGTSNTIMLIETNAENAVPWTAPQDWEVDHNEPNVAAIFFNQITQVAMGDGSVQTLSENIDLEVLKALLTRDGGEVVNW